MFANGTFAKDFAVEFAILYTNINKNIQFKLLITAYTTELMAIKNTILNYSKYSNNKKYFNFYI